MPTKSSLPDTTRPWRTRRASPSVAAVSFSPAAFSHTTAAGRSTDSSISTEPVYVSAEGSMTSSTDWRSGRTSPGSCKRGASSAAAAGGAAAETSSATAASTNERVIGSSETKRPPVADATGGLVTSPSGPRGPARGYFQLFGRKRRPPHS